MNWPAITAVLALLYTSGGNAASNCGSINLASGTGASADLLAYVDKLILETGFNCSVSIAAGNPAEAIAAMIKKVEPAFISATPVEDSGNTADTSIDMFSLRSVNDKPIAGVRQGWWISAAAIEKHPELKTVLDVLSAVRAIRIANR